MHKYADPGALKQRNRTEKDVTSPITGLVYKIRKIDVIDFLVNGPLPLAEWAQGKEVDEIEQGIKAAAMEAMSNDPAMVPRLYDAILVQGVAQPQVVVGPECGDDEVLPDDLGEDRLWLAGEIMQFNGLLNDEQARSFRRAILAAAGRPVD